MRFYNHQHQHYCGIDLHVKTMYVCILDTTGQVLVHRNVPSTPAAFLEVVGPYRTGLVVAAECLTFVLGHALAMKAIHGGKAKNDKIDRDRNSISTASGSMDWSVLACLRNIPTALWTGNVRSQSCARYGASNWAKRNAEARASCAWRNAAPEIVR